MLSLMFFDELQGMGPCPKLRDINVAFRALARLTEPPELSYIS